MSRAHIETQKYWVMAINAALIAQKRQMTRGERSKGEMDERSNQHTNTEQA